MWVCSEIDVIGASYIPFDGSLGDHRPVMPDIIMGSVLGKHLENIVTVQVRRLNLKVTWIRESYIEKLEDLYI